ncbi:hypothetical protein [Streptomyces sp. MK37H]|uniref:hypothetical protein n=1 Tax=Streptomyces sp. MK37H TaxID=2699117 RepID=UPI001FF76761|nr:hypothetical protein [Streptomyces sp. MK37H]
MTAVPVACVDMGNPAGLAAKVLFIHGGKDQTCDYNSARTAYGELRAPKAFHAVVPGRHLAGPVPEVRAAAARTR